MSVGKEMKGIHVVVVAVNNMDEAVQSYQNLGFELLNRRPREQWGLEAAQFDAGNGSMIELLSVVDKDKPVAQGVRKFLDKNGEGVFEVAIQVGDIHAIHKFIKEKGVRIVAEPHPLAPNPNLTIMWVSPKSTHGVFLEYITG